MKKYILFLVIALVAVMCKKKEVANVDASVAPQEQIKMGQEVYQANCSSCHGQTGEGDGPATAGGSIKPTNFKKDQLRNGNDIDSLVRSIEEGIPGTVMVAWKDILTNQQVKAVATYVKSLTTK